MILEQDIEKGKVVTKSNFDMTPVAKSMHEELEEAAKESIFYIKYIFLLLIFIILSIGIRS